MSAPKQMHVAANFPQDFTEEEKAQARENIGAVNNKRCCAIWNFVVFYGLCSISSESGCADEGVYTTIFIKGNASLSCNLEVTAISEHVGTAPLGIRCAISRDASRTLG